MRKREKQNRIKFLRHGLFLCALLIFSACSSSGSFNTAKLAPLPPGGQAGNYEIASAADAARIMPAAGRSVSDNQWATARHERPVLAAKGGGSVNCAFKERFDRDALFAYEFGTNERKRLALDVDGINLDNTQIKGVKVSFTYRLQADKPKAQRCRYSSGYQGLIGSGYNEFYIRDSGHTVWKEIDDVRGEIEDRLGI